ncbi:MAG: hypothetical protein V4594_16830 [Bacteroidota bacterium]
MKKSDYFSFAFLIAFAVFGFWLKGFPGGILVGISWTLLVFATIGKYLAHQAIKKIDKNVHDHIINRKKDSPCKTHQQQNRSL